MNKNTILLIGKNKTGKTKKVLFSEVNKKIENNENLLILDSKEEYYNNFAKNLIEKDYDIKVINFKDPSKSNGWNPLSYVKYLYDNGNFDKAVEILNMMGKEIFRNENPNSDPYWTNMSTYYFIGLCLILLKISKEESDEAASQFYSILQVSNEGEEKYSDTTYLREYCKNLNSMDPIRITLDSIINAPTETRGSIISVFKEKINNYFMRSNLVKSFRNDGFHIEDCSNNKKTAVFVIGYKPLNSLVNILINQITDYILTKDKTYNIILDDFDSLPRFNDLEEIIKNTNHSNTNLYLTATNKEDLFEKYKGDKFKNIEETIELNEFYEEILDEVSYPLPDLLNYELMKFDFKKYVK